MAPVNRAPLRVLALVAIATVFGASVGQQLTQRGLAVAQEFGGWVAVVAGSVLVVGLLVWGRDRSRDVPAEHETAWTEFRRELRRARRHRRALTLMRIPGKNGAASTSTRDLSDRIGARLRLIDRAWVHDGSIYVMLPESSRAAASVAAERLMTLDPGLALDEVRVASFPDDGLTSGALIAAVHDVAIDQSPVPLPTAIRPLTDDGLAFVREEELSMGEVAVR